MFYAVTNHLFPKPEFQAEFLRNFARNDRPSITEKWGAPRWEMRRPVNGDEFLSASIWPSTERFDAWRSSPDIQASHRNTSPEGYSRRALLSFHDVLMNAAPGRAPVPGEPAAYPLFGPGTLVVTRRLLPKADHEQQVIDAYASLPVPSTPGWIWWDFWKLVKGEDWWSLSYFADEAALAAARATGYPYLTEPGDPSWYERPATETLHTIAIERIPGMSDFRYRLEPEMVSV